MNAYTATAAIICALSAFSPQQIGTPEAAPTIELVTLNVEPTLKAGDPYPVVLPYTMSGDGTVKIRQACFRWSGEGAYCFDVSDDRAARQVTARLRTGNPNQYNLAGYVNYQSNGHDKQSNTVSARIDVRQ